MYLGIHCSYVVIGTVGIVADRNESNMGNFQNNVDSEDNDNSVYGKVSRNKRRKRTTGYVVCANESKEEIEGIEDVLNMTKAIENERTPPPPKAKKSNIARREEKLLGIPTVYTMAEELKSHTTAVEYFKMHDVLHDHNGKQCSGHGMKSKGRGGPAQKVACKGALRVCKTKKEPVWYRFVFLLRLLQLYLWNNNEVFVS